MFDTNSPWESPGNFILSMIATIIIFLIMGACCSYFNENQPTPNEIPYKSQINSERILET